MRLTLTTFMTLDGVMQAPGGPNEDQSGGFEFGGWSVPYADDEFGQFMDGVFSDVDAFLLGRRTYEIFAAYWPRVTDPDDPVASKLNSLPKYVASETLEEATWQNTTIISGDVPAQVAKLKEQPGGELQVHGSGALAHTLIRRGLVDVYRLLVYPVMLGRGRRLFPDDPQPTATRLVESTTTSSGIMIGVYEAVGEPELGTFELDPEESAQS